MRPATVTADQAALLQWELAQAPADYPAELSPPGKRLEDLEPEQRELAAVALDGLLLQMQQLRMTQRPGSPGYAATTRLMGIASVTANQLRRPLAAPQKEPPHGEN